MTTHSDPTKEGTAGEILPCPFCGRSLERYENRYGYRSWHHPYAGRGCISADISIQDTARMRAKWNHRTSDGAQQNVAEEK